MRTRIVVFGLMLLTIASGRRALAGEEEKSVVPPKEQSVVTHASTTHGALQVTGVSAEPVDYFDVLRHGERAFEGNPKLLNGTLELTPGTYVVEVNRTRREVTIEAGKKTILRTGELVVEGRPASAYWYPMQGKERKLAANPPLLNTPRALFPGTYTVFVHVSVTTDDKNLGDAEVKAGQKTVLKH